MYLGVGRLFPNSLKGVTSAPFGRPLNLSCGPFTQYGVLLCGIFWVLPLVATLTEGFACDLPGEGSRSPTLRIKSTSKNSLIQKQVTGPASPFCLQEKLGVKPASEALGLQYFCNCWRGGWHFPPGGICGSLAHTPVLTAAWEQQSGPN